MFSNGLRDPTGDHGDDRPWIIIQWGGGRWTVEVEAYVEEDVSEARPLEDVHCRFILAQYGLAEDLVPLRSVATTAPDKLERLAATLRQLGGADRLRRLFGHLGTIGLSVDAYLGGGGWGDVFLVRSAKQARPTALKILRPPYDEEWRQRFAREAECLQKLSASHSRVARLVQGITECCDFLYIQTEFVSGTPMTELTLPVSGLRVIDIAKQILQALKTVHDQGVIHRDLHLGNVMATDDGAVLLDFGLARDEAGAEYYATFRPVGAMTHCAPEKWLQPSKAGAASDIYSVGVMLYKLATGQSLGQPINTRLEQACGRIREATNGQLEIRFFPASQLGSDTDVARS